MAVPVVKVYDKLNTTLVATLSPSATSGVLDVSIQRQISKITPGSVTVPLDHPSASSLVFGNVVRVYDADEAFLGAFVIHEVEREEVSGDEAAGQVITASGESLLSVLKRALVRGWVRDPAKEPQSDVMAFEMFSPKWDRESSLSNVLVEMDRSESQFPVPQGWPDPYGLPVWPEATTNNNTHPVSIVQAIRDFTLAQETEVVFYATADDRFRLLCDGVDLLSAQEAFPAETHHYCYRVGAVLSAGTHRLGIEAANDANTGPGMFQVSVWKKNLVAQNGGALVFSAATPTNNAFIGDWRRSYLGAPYTGVEFREGFTALNILRILIAEAQADGALPSVTMNWDFGSGGWAATNAKDTAGTQDVLLPGFTARVDSTVWDAVEALCEERIDVDIAGDVNGFRLDVWVRIAGVSDGMGTISTDEIVEGENLVSLTRTTSGSA